MSCFLAVLCYIAGMMGMRQLIRLLYKDPASRKEHRSAAQFCVVFWPIGVMLIAIGIASHLLEKWIFDQDEA